MHHALVCITATSLLATAAIGAEWPDPNPAPNGDGTNTWYVGNNTQYPIIQHVLDACGDGDEIVVAGGLYVESLTIDNNDITLRPFCEFEDGYDGRWAEVTFWNPTEGFENDNQYAIYITGGNNTYIGRPRMLTQLPNGHAVATEVTPGEWDPQSDPVDVRDVYGKVFEFWSRSIDNVAVYSHNGQATFQKCRITSKDGFGGGAMVTGEANTTQFISCDFRNTFAGGQPFDLNGEPVCVITIRGGEPQFYQCTIANCEGGESGIVNQVGGGVNWVKSFFAVNTCMAGEGMYQCTGGTPNFFWCQFFNNASREGTVYFDSTGVDGSRFMNFIKCHFFDNTTSGDQYGGVLQVVCNDCEGDAPEVSFSYCNIYNNNGNSGLGLYDIDSPYFPKYRIAIDNYDGSLVGGAPGTGVPGDVNADGLVDTTDLDELFAMLGTCTQDSDYSGDVQIGDLLNLISVYGNSCN